MTEAESATESKELPLSDLAKKANQAQQPEKIGTFTAEESMGLFQREVGLADFQSEKPVLASLGATVCFIIAIYNPVTRKAALGHVDVVTDLTTLDPIFNTLVGTTHATLEVHLTGGTAPTEKRGNQEVLAATCSWQTRFLSYLKGKPQLEIKSANIGIPNDFGTFSLAIDARTGEVFTRFESKQCFDEKEYDRSLVHFNETHPTGTASHRIPLKIRESKQKTSFLTLAPGREKAPSSGTGKVLGYAVGRFFDEKNNEKHPRCIEYQVAAAVDAVKSLKSN